MGFRRKSWKLKRRMRTYYRRMNRGQTEPGRRYKAKKF